MLPAAISGVATWRGSGPGSDSTGGDFCPAICPAEIAALAKDLGVPAPDVHVGLAMAPGVPVVVLAFVAPGATGERLQEAWVQGHIKLYAGTTPPQPLWPVTVSGKKVTWAWYSFFPGSTEYLYVHGDVLYVIRNLTYVDLPKDVPPPTPPAVAAAIEALP